MNTVAAKLTLTPGQLTLFREAKKSVEAELGGSITDDQFIQMMVMESVRKQVSTWQAKDIPEAAR